MHRSAAARLTSAVVFLTACGGSDSGAASHAEYLSIPDCTSPAPNTLRINNRGLYVKCGSGTDSSVHRLELGGPSPDWYTHQHGASIIGFEPTKRDSEKSDEFSIFYFNLQEHGFFSVNSDSPAVEMMNPNTGVAHVEHMLVDHSPSANRWAFVYGGAGWEVNRIDPRSPAGKTVWEPIIPAPAPGGYEFVEADDADAVVWAAQGSKLTRVSVTKDIETVDLSKISALSQAISKIRVKNREAWVLAGTKIFRVKSMKDISLFAENTVSSLGGVGGSFAVDGNFVYLTDGRKISIDSGASSEFFATSVTPASGTQPDLDDIMMRIEFSTSMNLEVSTDPLDPYVYMVSTSSSPRILRVPK